jgi:putative DNA methylase
MATGALYADLSAMSRVEAHRKNIYRPPYYIHKWWARRTGSVFRGIALDLLLPPEEDVMEAYYRRHDFSDVIVLDPFMGGGTTLGECLRLGAKVVGCDLNPVAWFLVSQAMREVRMPALLDAYEGVAARVADPLSDMYRVRCESCDGEAVAQYVAWIKQVPCESCGDQADLHLSNVVMADMATKGAGLVDCPSCGYPWWVEAVRDSTACRRCGHRFIPAVRRARNTHYCCDNCGHDGRILDALADAREPPRHRMRCLTVWCERCGKRHQAPAVEDVRRYADIAAETEESFDRLRIPRSKIPEGHNTNQMRRYGYRYWWQMFNLRQLAGLDRLFGAIREVEDQASRELLTLLASGALEFNSMFCGAKGLGTGAIRHVFAHHAFIPAKEPLEANLWGVHRSSGGFSTLFKERLLRAREWAQAPVERRFLGTKAQRVPIPGERLAARPADSFEQLVRAEADMLVLNQSSEDLYQIPDASVDLVITDPPYADSVMYSELSDYFYVWLREALGQEHPSFRTEHVDDRREAVHNRGRGRDGDFYSQMLGLVFAEAMRTLKPGGRLAFTFHHSGENAWGQVLGALRTGGIVVERWWPVFAEMESGVPLRGKENNGHLDIVFVCGRRHEIVQPASQDPAATMTRNLAQRVPLVAADHRALIKAKALAEASWADPDTSRLAA